MHRVNWLMVVAATVVALVMGGARSDDEAKPLDLGFEGKALDKSWIVPTPGWQTTLSDDHPGSGATCVLFEREADSTSNFGNLMRMIDAAPYRGKRVALTSKVRVVGEGRVQMWLRVDRENNQTGAFDNMFERPIVASEGWKPATIQLDIEDDARSLAIGFMTFATTAAYFDDVSLAVLGPAVPPQAPSDPTALTDAGLANVVAASKLLSYLRFFSPSDETAKVGNWNQLTLDAIEAAEPARDPSDLARRLLGVLQPVAPTLEIWPGGIDQAPPPPAPPASATALASWKHLGAGSVGTIRQGTPYFSTVEFERLSDGLTPATFAECLISKALGAGISCRWALRAGADAAGTLPHGSTPLAYLEPAVRPKFVLTNRTTRLAGVALAWGVFQHFYPYFDVVPVDWDAALASALSKAATDADAYEYLATLRLMVAKLHDGHGNVMNQSLPARSMLPLSVEWAGKDLDELVVVGVHPTIANDVRVGDVIEAIDGRSAAECYAEVATMISAATEGWSRWSAKQWLEYRLKTNDPAIVRLRRVDGAVFEIPLQRVDVGAVAGDSAKRPDNGTELAPGIMYFNLAATDSAALAKARPALDAARGIVFDMRGYPNQAAYEVIQHLIAKPATSARWNVPQITKPDHEEWKWMESGRWNMMPLLPHWNAQVAFVTDGRAISYAESIMGIVEHYQLGAIVGSTTAGTNGNVNPFELPGGISVSWTGMRVLKHDGSRHHGVGIAPTDPVRPTAKGIAAGRDEVLEKAVEVVKERLAKQG